MGVRDQSRSHRTSTFLYFNQPRNRVSFLSPSRPLGPRYPLRSTISPPPPPSPVRSSILFPAPLREWPLLTHHGRLLSPTGFSSRFRNDNRAVSGGVRGVTPERVAQCAWSFSFALAPRALAPPFRRFTYGVAAFLCEQRTKERGGNRTAKNNNKNAGNEWERVEGAVAWSALRVISRPLIICPAFCRGPDEFSGPPTLVTPLRSDEHPE